MIRLEGPSQQVVLHARKRFITADLHRSRYGHKEACPSTSCRAAHWSRMACSGSVASDIAPVEPKTSDDASTPTAAFQAPRVHSGAVGHDDGL